MPGLGINVAPTSEENGAFEQEPKTPFKEKERDKKESLPGDKQSGVGTHSLSSYSAYTDFGLHQAAREGAVEALKKNLQELINEGHDILRVIEITDAEGFAPLHHAAKSNRKEALILLIENGAFIDRRGEDENTPLHLAAKYNSVATARLLIDRGASVGLRNCYGTTPLHFAARRGNTEIAKLLINHPEIIVDAKDNAGATPLHQAAICGDLEITRDLIKKGADIFAEDVEKETALHFAAEEGNDHVVDVILSSFAHSLEEADGAANDNVKKEFINRKSAQLDTALHLACTSGYKETVEKLIEHGADVNLHADGKVSPLHLAATSGNIEVAKILLNYHAKINARDKEQLTPLHRASMFGRIEMIQFLLERGANINAKDVDGYTPLLSASWKGQTEAIMLLIEKDARIKVTDASLKTCLHLAVEEGNCKTLVMLLENGAAGLVNTTDKHYKTPLHYAAQMGNLEALQVLLKHGAKGDHGDNVEKTALHYAAEKGKPRCVESLCKAHGGIINTTDDQGRMPLHLAARNGNVRAVRILVDMGAEIDARDDTAWTPLDYAAKFGFWKSMGILLENDAPVDARDKNNNTPLHWAAANGHVDCVVLLLDYGADISLKNIEGKNCLDLAVDNFQQETCMGLVTHSRWREVLDNVDEAGSTPMRKLIMVAPSVALTVCDKCIAESKHTKGHEDFSVTYDLRYIDRDPSSPFYDDRSFEPVTMAAYNREDLLSHPLTKKLMAYKWAHLGRGVYYTTLTMYLFFVACVTSVVVIEREADRNILLKDIPNGTLYMKTESVSSSTAFTTVVPAMTAVICILNIIKELIQMFIQRKKYFQLGNNYLEWTLYISTMIFMLDFLFAKETITFQQKWTAGAISVFLTWINLLLFMTRFPYFGVYVEMFVEVFATVLRVMLVFSIFLVAFSLSFYTLLRELPTFSTVEKSLMKVAVMTIGELEYDNVLTESINTNATSGLPKVPMEGITYTIYSIFLLLMPIILMNLLVGLAVGDIEAVRKTAYIRILKQQVDILRDMHRNYPRFMLRWAYAKQITIYPNKASFFERIRQILGYDDDYDYWKEEQAEQQGKEEELTATLQQSQTELQKQKRHIKQLKNIVKEQGALLKRIAAKLDVDGSDDEDD